MIATKTNVERFAARKSLLSESLKARSTYEPTGLQEEIIAAVGCGNWQIIWVEDANKVGKTRTLAEIAKNIIWPCDERWFAWWEGQSVFKQWPYKTKRFRITGTPTNVAESGPIWQEIKAVWPKDRYTADKAGKHYFSQIETDTGWSGDVMTYEQAPTEFEGPMLSLVLSDEPPKPTLVGSIMSRFAEGGIWLITATPINCGGLLDVLDDLESKGTRVKRLTGTIWENSNTTGKENHLKTRRGLWSDQQITDYVATIPLDERDARLEGKGSNKSGKVYPMYAEEVHDIDFDLTMLPECDLYMAIDPHRKYYPAILWFAVTPSSAVVVYNEWPKFEDLGMWYDEARNLKVFDKTELELANIILANDLTTQYGGVIAGRVGDPRFLAENVDFVPKLMERGVMGWRDAPYERIETQRDNLRTLLSYNPAIPVCGANMPDWLYDRRCKNARRAAKRHYWGDKDKEAEEHKDMIDNKRYFLSIFPNGRPVFVERDKGGARVKDYRALQREAIQASMPKVQR